MILRNSIILYFIIVLITYLIAQKYQITKWSSLVLALLVGIISLSLVFPISSIENVSISDPFVYIYTIIQLTTVFVILWYIIYSALTDRKCIYKIYECDQI